MPKQVISDTAVVQPSLFLGRLLSQSSVFTGCLL